MAESLRERAIVALIARLGTMTGPRHWGGAYPNTIRVERKLWHPDAATQTPLLCVIEGADDGPRSTFRFEETVGGQISIRHDLRLLVAGIVEDRDNVSAQTWLQRLWFDVVKTILAGSTLGGLVSAVRLGDELTTDEGTLAPRAAFVQAVSIDCSETMDTD